jgi:predicted alpha/beta-hydrolase family hydrolase
LVYFGFPLHAMGKPGAERAAHLTNIEIPMLFLQGSRDGLADLKLLKPLCKNLGKQAALCIVEGGDHSFHMLKSARKTDEQALRDVVEKATKWILRNA